MQKDLIEVKIFQKVEATLKHPVHQRPNPQNLMQPQM